MPLAVRTQSSRTNDVTRYAARGAHAQEVSVVDLKNPPICIGVLGICCTTLYSMLTVPVCSPRHPPRCSANALSYPATSGSPAS